MPVLQIQTILGQVTKSGIRKALDLLSVDISQAYDKAFETIQRLPAGQRDLAMNSLLWITYAKRPLSVQELRYALGTRILDQYFDEDNLPLSKLIIKSCSGLVSVENESSDIRLVHFTLQRYIQDQHHFLFSHAESFITQTCLTYLLFDLKVQSDGWLSQSSLFKYAIEYWGDHARSAPIKEIEALALRFLTDSTRLRALYKTNKDITGLHLTAGFGLSELSLILVQGGASVKALDAYYESPLHKACKYHWVDTVRILLENGADVNATNLALATPLYIAISTGDVRTADLLLNYGAAINRRSTDGWTPLHKAADCGYYDCAELLLRRGANRAGGSARGLTALHRAAGRGHIEIVKLLLGYDAEIDAVTDDGWTPLHGACSSGQEATVQLLLERGANIDLPSTDGKTPLHRACRGGHSSTVSILLEYGANVMVADSYGSLPLHRAATGGYDTVIQQLLQQHPEQLLFFDLSGSTAKTEAQINGFHTTESLLREMEFSLLGVPSQEQSDIESAIKLQDEDKISRLISENANIEVRNSDGLGPLHHALILNSYRIASLLLQNGADVNGTTTTNKWAPLHYAALKGNPNLVQLCIEHGAVIDTRNGDGQTALHKACQSGNVESVGILLEKGADIEAKDNWEWRPLHKAANNGHKNVLKVLLEHDAIITARTMDGQSVQACAARSGHHALVEFLRDKRVEMEVKQFAR